MIHYEYTPYGEQWVEEESDQLDKIAFKFTGKELDPETGLYYFGARYLDPHTSRWMSTDPVYDGLKLGKSIYSYCSNNPIKYTDPDGFQKEIGGFWGMLFGIAKYKYDPDQHIFYTTTEAFQQYGGYYDVYDQLANTGIMFRIDYLKVSFKVGDTDYNIRAWKGNYWGAAGGEIGIYTGKSILNQKEYSYKSDIVDISIKVGYDEAATGCGPGTMLKMGFTITDEKGDPVLTRDAETNWWVIGLKPLANFSLSFKDKLWWKDTRGKFTMDGSIEFGDDSKMADAFVEGLKKAGFTEFSGKGEQPNNTYTKEGNTVKFKWK